MEKTTPKAIEPKVENLLLSLKEINEISSLLLQDITNSTSIYFENKNIRELVGKVLKVAHLAITESNVSEDEIESFVTSAIDEISLRCNNRSCIKYSVGDIVECNYGKHLSGEMNGCIPAIVCDISDAGMPYVVPIVRSNNNRLQHGLPICTEYADGIVLLRKGKEVRPERFQKVMGKVTPKFLSKILSQLPTTFDFTAVKLKPDKSDKIEKPDKVDYEAALIETIGFALDRLDNSKEVEEQVGSFLADIGMTTNEELITKAFIVACTANKVTYTGILNTLCKKFPEKFRNMELSVMQRELKQHFRKWLENYPELAKRCPYISIMTLLKIFAKKIC